MTSGPDTAAGVSGLPGALLTARDAAAWLRSAQAVRSRANAMLALAERGALEHFVIHPERIDPAAGYVVETIVERYPSLAIPFHSRWRHFASGGTDRWARLAGELEGEATVERARIRFDLAVTSVLLDAGAGHRWRYRDPDTGVSHARSEGLAVASLQVFREGLFSSRPGAPLRADAGGLAALTGGALARAFQVTTDNPLVGLEQRAALMRRLAAALEARPDMFGSETPRIGHLFDYLAGRASSSGSVPAPVILETLLEGLAGIWPERPKLDGIELGDVWRHPGIRADDATDGWVPFHKLSQWLVYSLVEPLEEAGIGVTDLDALTGLPEYRNGGLLIDLGVLEMRDPAAASVLHAVDSVPVVEWRALTVALLDRLADRIREQLGRDAAQLPLISILEGGTWQAGRRIARERRGETAPPPLQVISDGTVF